MITRIRKWLKPGTASTSLAMDDVTENANTHRAKRELEEIVDKAVAAKFADKDNIVRDVQYEALDRLSKIVKVYSTLIGVPVGIIVAFFAVEGVKDLRGFFQKIEPRIKAAQSAIVDEQGRLKTQQAEIDDNDHQTAALRTKLNGQQHSVDSFRSKIAGLDPQIYLLQKQLDSLKGQANTIVAQTNENRLDDDFASFARGKTILLLDSSIYKTPENPLQTPIVYLTSYASITSDHDMSDINRFSDGLGTLGFKFVHGFFSLQSGRNNVGVNMVPNPYCTQVIYYDSSFEEAAKKVSALIATSFHLKAPIVKLVSVNSMQIDPVSKAAIQMAGVNVAAAVAIPSAETCGVILSSY